jgi:Flp pilus assembly protein TadG
MFNEFRGQLDRFARDERGAVSAWSILWTVIFVIVGGFAVDVANALKVRAHLQAAADVAAHAAVIALPDEDAARAEAIRIAERNVSTKLDGEALSPEDIRFGTWSSETGFTEGGAFPDTVQVLASREFDKSNPVPTFLLKVGILDFWQVGAQATAQRYTPPA